jgi:hypothetical protein
MYEIKNAIYNHKGTINLDYNHPVYGWIPFTAEPDDVEPLGGELHALALAGTVAPFVPFTTEQLRANYPTITPRQFWIAAASIGIAKSDVLAAIDLIEDVPERLRMQIEVLEATVYERTNPYIDDLATILGVSGTELDALWMWATEV